MCWFREGKYVLHLYVISGVGSSSSSGGSGGSGAGSESKSGSAAGRLSADDDDATLFDLDLIYEAAQAKVLIVASLCCALCSPLVW